jgi:hypothetical protein
VLTVEVPKAAEAKPKAISIKDHPSIELHRARAWR